jgi:hypothetical protein
MEHSKGPFRYPTSFANSFIFELFFHPFHLVVSSSSNRTMPSFDWNLFINEPDAEVVTNLAKGTREKVQEARGSFLRSASSALQPGSY